MTSDNPPCSTCHGLGQYRNKDNVWLICKPCWSAQFPKEPPICDDHDFTQFEEEYYGYRCPRCKMFIPDGCEPWAPEEQEPDNADFDDD
jgi:hypothetical protein